MNTHDIELPPLPEWVDWPVTVSEMSASEIKEAMQAYALAAIEATLRPDAAEFELVQDGIPVAGASGKREDAWREIQHYAAQYSEDGPVEIYEIIRRRVEGEGE